MAARDARGPLRFRLLRVRFPKAKGPVRIRRMNARSAPLRNQVTDDSEIDLRTTGGEKDLQTQPQYSSTHLYATVGAPSTSKWRKSKSLWKAA